MLEAMTSMRRRWAVSADALMSKPPSFKPHLPPRYAEPQHADLVVDLLHVQVVPELVRRQKRHFPVDVDVVAVMVQRRGPVRHHPGLRRGSAARHVARQER